MPTILSGAASGEAAGAAADCVADVEVDVEVDAAEHAAVSASVEATAAAARRRFVRFLMEMVPSAGEWRWFPRTRHGAASWRGVNRAITGRTGAPDNRSGGRGGRAPPAE
jgi:hypothetical protein